MTDIATVKENRNIYSDTGKTSPLSAIPTSSPTLLKTGIKEPQPMTIDSDSIRPTTSYNDTIPTSEKSSNSKTEETTSSTRSKSIVSDESSDLSELDSEAETERMYNGEESQLSRLSKVSQQNGNNEDESEATIQPEVDNDTFIKEEIIDELKHDKNDSEIEVEQDLTKAVEELKKEEETSGSNAPINEIKSKRRLSDVSDDVPKKRKVPEDNDNEGVLSATIDADANEVDNEGEDEGEGDEDEGDDEDDDELTQEQKLQKQEEYDTELEKQKQRKEAIQFLTEIEIDFAKLRDRLYEDKMERFKSELEMCLNGSHPELQSVYAKIDAHREEKLRLATLNQAYALESIDRKTRSQRTAIHQQYYKRVSEFKSTYTRDITKDWYKINKERRDMDLLVPDFSYRIPEYVDELVHERRQVNNEISILVGLNEYYGFPRAPKLKSIESEDLDNDLKAMNIL